MKCWIHIFFKRLFFSFKLFITTMMWRMLSCMNHVCAVFVCVCMLFMLLIHSIHKHMKNNKRKYNILWVYVFYWIYLYLSIHTYSHSLTHTHYDMKGNKKETSKSDVIIVYTTKWAEMGTSVVFNSMQFLFTERIWEKNCWALTREIKIVCYSAQFSTFRCLPPQTPCFFR